MYAYKIDDEGFILDNYHIDGDVAVPEGCITVQLPQPLPFYKPKWNGTEWVEGESVEETDERESQQLLESLKPSAQEINDSELEIRFITILMDLGVVQ